MKSAIFASALALATCFLAACANSSAPVVVNGASANSSAALSTNSNTPVVVMGGATSLQTANPAGAAAIVAEQSLNTAAAAIQQAGSALTAPLAPKTNVYTTSPGLLIVQPTNSTWTPFPAVAPSYPNVYVIGAGGTAQPAGTTSPLTPAQTNQAVNTAAQIITRTH